MKWLPGVYTRRFNRRHQFFGHLSAQAKAEGLLAAERARLGWTAADLARRRQGDRVKVRLAAKLRAETTMTLGWIAQRLPMGPRGHLTPRLDRPERTPPPEGGPRPTRTTT